uniref:Gamma-glutamyltranspeptidase / glutathione hydrolase / leukotriene-C4 hydrolase n=1 Tax=Rhipicephalus appendiculatus TaxID=34631 RepID=A0A131Z1T5_RHIAP
MTQWNVGKWPALAVGLLLTALAHNTHSTVPDSCDNESFSCNAPEINKSTNISTSVLGNYSTWATSMDAEPCANVSRNIYAKGGKTVDAAIATLLCMGVVLPHSMGIGGGFIATVYSKNKSKVEVLMARETAPGCAHRDMFVNQSALVRMWGGMAVAVPGELRGYEELHKHLNGSLKWENLFEDAIRLARQGFRIGKHLAAAIKMGKKMTSALANQTKKAFMNASGELLVEGDLLIQEDLADTLKKISEEGASYFYNGSLAKEIVAKVQNTGGIMTEEDLKNYTVKWVEPVNVSLEDGRTLYSAPPPGSGPVLGFILGIMNKFLNQTKCLEDTVTTLHRFAESCKFGYAKRALLGDPDFVNCTEVVRDMTSPQSFLNAKNKINDSCTYHDPGYYGFVNETILQDTGTSHAVFWGTDGVVISLSSTINGYFGSLVRTDSGVLLNNEMDDFSTPGKANMYSVEASQANYIAPGKRPMSSMAPLILLNDKGEVVLAIGGTGGSKITSGVAMVTMRTLWQAYNIKEAIDQPRIHHQLIPDNLMAEWFFPEDYQNDLKDRGHNVTVVQRYNRFNVIMGVHKKCGRLYANADFRKGGAVDGD